MCDIQEFCAGIRTSNSSFKPSGQGSTLSGLGLLGLGVLLLFQGTLCPVSQLCNSGCTLHLLSLRAGSFSCLIVSSPVPGSGGLPECCGM